MIPYINATVIQLGPIPIQVWGLFVATGIAVGLWVAARRAHRLGLKPALVYDVATATIAAAFVGARLGHSLVYDWATTLADPVEIVRVWHGGFSIMGGFVAAVGVAFWQLRRRQVDVWAYADAMIFGLPIGLGIGRIGCFLIHDHPGTASDFLLAVSYPDGVTRHDHGLYLSINGFLMAIAFWFMARKKLPVGAFLSVFGVWYGAVRFWLDFYRVLDVRFWGLTPAQYGCIVLVGAGAWGLWMTCLKPWVRHDKIRP